MASETTLLAQMEIVVLQLQERPRPIEMVALIRMVTVILMLMAHGMSPREPMHSQLIQLSGLILITMDLEIT